MAVRTRIGLVHLDCLSFSHLFPIFSTSSLPHLSWLFLPLVAVLNSLTRLSYAVVSQSLPRSHTLSPLRWDCGCHHHRSPLSRFVRHILIASIAVCCSVPRRLCLGRFPLFYVMLFHLSPSPLSAFSVYPLPLLFSSLLYSTLLYSTLSLIPREPLP